MSEIDHVGRILEKIKLLLIEKGFKDERVVTPYKDQNNLVYKNLYSLPTYMPTFGYFIQYADSLEEAKNNMYEDGRKFHTKHFTEEGILAGISDEVDIEMRDANPNNADV